MFKRLALSLLTVGAVAGLVAGGTFALFTDSASNEANTFTAGTVDLGTPTGFTCSVNADNLAPGDSGSCSISVTYSGSLNAWIGMDYTTSGALFEGANPMTTSVAGNLAVVGGKHVIGEKSDTQSAEVTINYTFPSAAGNEYQSAQGNINLTFYAVQARNNTNNDGNGPNSWN